MHSTLNLDDSNALLAVPEWGKLLRHFELGEGFALVVLLVPDTAVARMCQIELDLWLQARQRPRLTPVPVENPESLEQLPEELLSMLPPSGPVWISGVGTRDRYELAWQRCAVKLNRTRDAIVSRYSATLILVGPLWVREILRDNAPDFWSIRAFVADISLPRRTLLSTSENLQAVQTTVDESPDPDFALAQAVKLRDRPELQRELSLLLDRAGRGLMQRGRFKEAEKVFRELLQMTEMSVRQQPDRADYLQNLSVSYERLGDPMLSLGASEEAREFYRKALDIRERLVRQEPERADYLSDLVLSLYRIGGIDALRRAMDILRRMESEHKLTRAQADWMPLFEQALAVAEQD